jgi:O-antigen/teichoic acid export membrane protein
MSRVKKTLINARVNIVFYAISMVVAFFSRKIFLDYLGADFVGLTGTLYGVLGFLNIAELGVSTAVGYTLYKPIFEKDNNEINKILSLLGYIYKKIAIIILVLGILISFIFPWMFADTAFSFGVIYFAFFAFLTSSLIGYFFNFHQIILSSDQKNYIITKYYQGAFIIKLLVQIFLVYFFKNYYIWIVVELVFAILYSIILRKVVKKEYPYIETGLKVNIGILNEYPEVIRKVKQIFVQKIAYFVLTGTDNILIYFFANLKSVAYVGNYQLVISSIMTLTGNVFAGTSAAIGNVVAEGNIKNIKKIFWEMMVLRYFVASSLFITNYLLINKFIFLWLGDEYILNEELLILMLIIMVLNQIRVPVMNYLNAYGLFSDVWASIAETLINLFISLVFGYLWGIKGIFLGTIISMGLLVIFWKPYFLFKNAFKTGVLGYWISNFWLILPFLIVFPISKVVFGKQILEIETFMDWVLIAIQLVLFSSIFLMCLFFIFNKGFRDLSNRLINLINTKFLKK